MQGVHNNTSQFGEYKIQAVTQNNIKWLQKRAKPQLWATNYINDANPHQVVLKQRYITGQ
jgi:hypothetical protein